MKSLLPALAQLLPKSRPARGAWIEILRAHKKELEKQSRPARGAWIEIQNQ